MEKGRQGQLHSVGHSAGETDQTPLQRKFRGLGGVSWPGEQQRPLIGRSPSVSHTQGTIQAFEIQKSHCESTHAGNNPFLMEPSLKSPAGDSESADMLPVGFIKEVWPMAHFLARLSSWGA
ncbi:Sorcin [Manis javanica]|nr:Sorcin [Manis javanica]